MVQNIPLFKIDINVILTLVVPHLVYDLRDLSLITGRGGGAKKLEGGM